MRWWLLGLLRWTDLLLHICNAKDVTLGILKPSPFHITHIGNTIYSLNTRYFNIFKDYTFCFEFIKTMGRGLQDTDFALRSQAYMAEREAGHDP